MLMQLSTRQLLRYAAVPRKYNKLKNKYKSSNGVEANVSAAVHAARLKSYYILVSSYIQSAVRIGGASLRHINTAAGRLLFCSEKHVNVHAAQLQSKSNRSTDVTLCGSLL